MRFGKSSIHSNASSGGYFNNSNAIATDKLGNVWVINGGNNSITQMLAADQYKQAIVYNNGQNGCTFINPNSFAIDSNGNVYIGNSNGTITELQAPVAT